MSEKTWLSLLWSDRAEEGMVDWTPVRKPAVVESGKQGFVHRNMCSGLCTVPGTQKGLQVCLQEWELSALLGADL